VVYNELFEGAAVIESQPYASPASQYHGFGLDRLAIVKQFFGHSHEDPKDTKTHEQ
jgi:hypothetical protein